MIATVAETSAPTPSQSAPPVSPRQVLRPLSIRVRLRATAATCCVRMKGRDRFSRSEADEIRRLLHLVRRAEPGRRQKLLRDQLRAIDFYISDFAGGPARFTRSDFDDLVRDGRVTITDRPPASAAGALRSAKPLPRVAQRASARESLPHRWLSGHVVATARMKSECSSSVSPHPPGARSSITRTPSCTTLRARLSRRLSLHFGAQTTSSTPSNGWAAT